MKSPEQKGMLQATALPASKTKKKKPLGVVGRTVLATVLGFTAVEGIGAVVKELNNDKPAAVENIPSDLAWPGDVLNKILGHDVPSVFDRNADEATIKAGVNAEPVTDADLAKIKTNITPPPNPLEEHGLPALPEFNLLLPFILQDGDRIDMSKGYSGPGVDVDTGKVVEPRHAGFIKFTVAREGTEVTSGIYDPEATSIEVFRKKPFVVNGTEYFGGVTIKVTRKDGTQYGGGYFSPKDVRGLTPLPILNNAPTFEDTKDLMSKKGIIVAYDTPIMKTGIANAPIQFGASRISSTNSVNEIFFGNFQPFLSPDDRVLYKKQP